MALIDFVGGSDYISVSRVLCRALGPAAAVVYSELIDEYRFYVKTNKLDSDGMFYASVDTIESKTGVGRNQQQSVLRSLVDRGLLISEKKGLPARRYVKIIENPEFLRELFLEDTHKPRNIQKAENQLTSELKISQQVNLNSVNKSTENQSETNLINNPNTNLNNNVVEIFSKHDIDIRPVITKHPGIFDGFSAIEIYNIAKTIKNKADKGKIKNPIGFLLNNPDLVPKILVDAVYPEKAKKTYTSEEYPIYVPPGITP